MAATRINDRTLSLNVSRLMAHRYVLPPDLQEQHSGVKQTSAQRIAVHDYTPRAQFVSEVCVRACGAVPRTSEAGYYPGPSHRPLDLFPCAVRERITIDCEQGRGAVIVPHQGDELDDRALAEPIGQCLEGRVAHLPN